MVRSATCTPCRYCKIEAICAADRPGISSRKAAASANSSGIARTFPVSDRGEGRSASTPPLRQDRSQRSIVPREYLRAVPSGARAAGGDLPHHRAPLGTGQLAVRGLGNHRPPVQCDLLPRLLIHPGALPPLRARLRAAVTGSWRTKRCLPMISQGEPRRRPAGSRRSPRWRTATVPAQSIPAGLAAAWRERRRDRGHGEPGLCIAGRATSPPSSTASADNHPASSPARAANRRTQPRAVVYGTLSAAAAGRTPHAPPATCPITAPAASATSSRHASVNAWQQRMRHTAATAPHPRREDLPAPPLPADMPPVTRPEHHGPQAPRHSPRHLHRPSRRRVLIDRQRARPYDRHGESPPPSF